MIFSYFLQISNHMWLDRDSITPGWVVQEKWDENNNTDEEVFDRLVDFIAERKYNMLIIDVGDGVKLDSHPEIAAPDAWSKEKLAKKLEYIRGKGIEPVPKMNFSCCHNTWQKKWRFMTGTPEHIAFCKDLIREVSSLFGSKYFHLGLDEETYEHQKYNGVAIVRNEKVFWHDCYELFDCCLECGARPWVFSDYYWHHPDLFVKYMPKTVLQSNWYYGTFDTRPEAPRYNTIMTYNRLDELGYDQVPVCSTWSSTSNAKQTLAYCKEKLSADRLLGFMTIPWRNTTATEYYTLMSDADRLYTARKLHYPDTL